MHAELGKRDHNRQIVRLLGSTLMLLGLLWAPSMAQEAPVEFPDEFKPLISGVAGFDGQTRVRVDSGGTVADVPTTTRLEHFGYNIFKSTSTDVDTVAGAVDLNYPVGPGDVIVISVWGQVELLYELTVGREGGITIPKVGRLQVAGVPIAEMQRKIVRFLAPAYSTIREDRNEAESYVEVSLGRLRMVQVFVVGEVQRPGAYMLSAMSNSLKALYLAGGPTRTGSLRNIQQIRHDKVVGSLDFYRFLLAGERGEALRLQNGDVVVVPPARVRVSLYGKVSRPALYELKPGEGLISLIEIAGGLEPDAYTRRVQINRIVGHRQRELIDINLSELMQEHQEFPLADGDKVTVFQVPGGPTNAVTLSGAVRRPGMYQLRPGATVSHLLERSSGVLAGAYRGRADVVRTHPELARELMPFHLGKALSGDPDHDLPLQPMDEIRVYSIRTFEDPKYVIIEGLVRFPGRYELLDTMTLQDLIVLAGGLARFGLQTEG